MPILGSCKLLRTRYWGCLQRRAPGAPQRPETGLARIPFPKPFGPYNARNLGRPRARVSPCCTRDNKATGSASCLDGLVASPFWHYYACVWERPSDRSNWLCRGGWKSSPRPGRAKYESIMIGGRGRHVNRQRNASSAKVGNSPFMRCPSHPTTKVGAIGVGRGTTGRFAARTWSPGEPFVHRPQPSSSVLGDVTLARSASEAVGCVSRPLLGLVSVLATPGILYFLVAAARCLSGKSFEFDPFDREFSLTIMSATFFY
jgi:hypothetical protein